MAEQLQTQPTSELANVTMRRRITAASIAIVSAASLLMSTPHEASAVEGCSSAGDVCVWGTDGYSQFGMDVAPTADNPSPQRITTINNVADLSSGFYGNTVAVHADGTVYQWGSYDGEITKTPQQVAGITDGIATTAGVTDYVLRSNHTVVGWGEGSRGQLGDGHIGGYDWQASPVTVGGLDNVKAIASMQDTLIALEDDGTVKTIGSGLNGRLGNGSDGVQYPHGSATPVNVTGLKDITAITASPVEGFALDKNGNVWGWGQNAYDLLGSDATSDALTPRQIPGLTGIVSISAISDNAAYALDKQGRVWFWGWDAGGSGSGNCHENQQWPTGPVQVQGLPKIASVSGISTNGYAITPDGVAYGWGTTWSGRLGSASLPQDLAMPDVCRTPVLLDNLGSVRKIIPGTAIFAIMGKPDVFTPAKLNYVALGDSYSSGEGAPNPQFINGTDQKGNLCHRSTAAYPELVFNKYLHEYTKFIFRACSGATIKDFYSANIEGNKNEPPQLSSLNDETGLVTLTIGGNNIGFSKIMQYCATRAKSYTTCRTKFDKITNDLIVGISSSTGDKNKYTLLNTYKSVKSAAKNAKILVVGYPRLFPVSPPATCKTGIGNLYFIRSDMQWLNEEGAKLNAAIKKQAQVEGLAYVDVQNAFNGHELCTKLPYINRTILDITSPDIAKQVNWSFHPKIVGQQVLAKLIEAKIG